MLQFVLEICIVSIFYFKIFPSFLRFGLWSIFIWTLFYPLTQGGPANAKWNTGPQFTCFTICHLPYASEGERLPSTPLILFYKLETGKLG